MGQWRGTQRYLVMQREDEDELTRAILQLASEYGRYGYRRITDLQCNPEQDLRQGESTMRPFGVERE